MNRRYVIFYWHLFTERDWIRYSCSEIEQRGYDIKIVQLSEALGGFPVTDIARRSFTGIQQTETPQDKDALLRTIDALAPEDLTVVASPVTPEYLWLHCELGRRGLRYVVLSVGRLPQDVPWQRYVGRNFRKTIGAFFRPFKHFAYRLKFHLNLLSKMGFEYFRIPPPFIWARAGSIRPWFATDGMHLWRSRIASVESFDVAWSRLARNSSTTNISGRYAVFVDEALCDHPDYKLNNAAPPATPEHYFPALQKLFDRIDTELGMQTVVALHPKADYPPEEFSKFFGDRPVIAAQTPALIRDASLVLLHNSTSLSYAAMYRKPAAFITSNEINVSWLRPELDVRAAWLDRPVVNIDAADDEPEGSLAIPDVNERIYAEFEDKLIRTKDAKIGPPMTVVVELFEQLCPSR